MRSTLLALALLAPTAQAGVTINEVLFDPASAGGDAGYEWFELYNDGGASVDLTGWSVEAGTSTFSNVVTFSGVSIAPGGYLLVGDSMVANTDVSATMSLGNASTSGDAIRLVDNTSAVIDVVVYGPDNSDGWLDENGQAVVNTAGTGASGSSIARVPDGRDTGDLAADFTAASTPTPGATNGAAPSCEASTGTVVINEFVANPAGTDGTVLLEWVELYSSSAVSLEGWQIERFSQPDNHAAVHTFTASDSIGAAGHFLLGEANVPNTDATSGTLGLYSGTGGDGVRLVDCQGTVVDTVVYGTANTDLLLDDTGSVATSLAPTPGDDVALARTSDGQDTDQSGVDFVMATTPTPGTANPVIQPPSCTAAPGGAVTINEFMVNPDGTDSDVLLEFVELHSTQAVDLEGWRLERFSQVDNFATMATLLSGDAILANDFFVVGEANVTGADHVTGGAMGMYSGSGGDGVRLVDCEGTVVDTVIYGPANDDGLLDDDGVATTSIAAQPGSNDVLARREDGIDTNDSGADFWVTNQATVGSANPTPPPPPVCTAWDGTTNLVINEFLSDPAGADGDALGEWVELYNPGSTAIDLEGWGIERFSQVDNHSLAATVPAQTSIPAGGYLVIGEANVTAADVVVSGTMGLYGGTGGDGLRLVDCEGTPIDTVVYAPPNDDGLIDDNGTVATSLAPKPGSDQAVARKTDGVDTDQSGDDFAIAATPTPGSANPEIICVPSDGSVVLNEVLTDPSGTDSDAATEFVELYNNSSSPVALDGWWFVAGGQDDDVTPDVVLPPATTIGANGFFVIGNFNVAEADLIDVFSVPNGSSGDFVRLYDCQGTLVDTVLYGGENTDGITDDNGAVPDPVTAAPGDDASVARVTDGVDSDAVDDWFVDGSPTPGATNYQEPYVPPDENGGGCNRNRDPGASGEPGGCAIVPLGGVELALLPLVLLRRRRS
ncbi:MAG: lamin tail domain-containing protein [Deltaproteobacteria bacterium]|nr:MAG: lamin tail domain-containing protein [Deltaproteobacteria bacterium]